MAASLRKRDIEHEYENFCMPNKTMKFSNNDDNKLSSFLTWCTSEGLSFSSKVVVSKPGSCAQYGMIASSPIAVGETLFEIPRRSLLTHETCFISELLNREKTSLQSESGWLPLLLCIMHETTSPNSRWRPYLDLFPDYSELDLPMFWSKDELAKLNGTGVVEAVERDLKLIEKEFNTIVLPFVAKHPSVFPAVCADLEFYKRSVAFVMAYSFTEPTKDALRADSESSSESVECKVPPMMVPVADILNHVAENNAKLIFGIDSLKMVATRPIDEGAEVFNTYGELANWQLLHMYGFAEPSSINHFDALELPMPKVRDVILGSFETSQQQFALQKWKFLHRVGVVSEDGAYVLGIPGFLTEEEMHETLKVMVMDEESFSTHEDKEGWSDADEEIMGDHEPSLSFGDVASLPDSWKELLVKIAEAFLQQYDRRVFDDDEEQTSLLRRRHCFIDYVKRGQTELLTQLIRACRVETADVT